MAGSSQFVPSLNAIASNQELQWMVQPSLGPPPGPSSSPRLPYSSHSGLRALNPSLHFRPGVIRAAASSGGSTRRRNDEHVRRAPNDDHGDLYPVHLKCCKIFKEEGNSLLPNRGTEQYVLSHGD